MIEFTVTICEIVMQWKFCVINTTFFRINVFYNDGWGHAAV
jgi:hypothetical protein